MADASFLSPIFSVAGSALSNIWNYNNQRNLNEQVANLSFQNQSRMLHKSDQVNRAYAHDQYSIFRDSLRKANMNPYIMSGAQAQGNTAQAGAGASGSSSPQVDFGDMGFQAGLGLKMAQERQSKELENMDAQTALTRAKTAKIEGVDTEEGKSRTELNKSQSALNDAQIDRISSLIDVDQATIEKLEAETFYLGKSDLDKELGDDPSLGDIANTLSKKIPDVAKDVVIGVGSLLMGFGFGKSILTKLFSSSVSKMASVLKGRSIAKVAGNILKDKELTSGISQSELSELEKAVAKRFGSDILK